MTEAEMKSTLHRQKIIYLKKNRKKKKKHKGRERDTWFYKDMNLKRL
jgi:hypothetical protein